MKNIHKTIAVLAIGTLVPFAAFAQGTPSVKVAPVAAPVAVPTVVLADGEIRKIDLDSGKVTIKHGPIKSLDMPPMTMVFVMREKSKLEGFKVGDKIKFDAVDEKGKMLVTVIERAK